jgi:DNA-binding transcriptional LysR family regulator
MGVALEHAAKTIELDSMFAVARAAQRGLGVALLPVELSQDWFASGSLVQPCRGELRTSERYYFVYRRDAAHNPDVTALRDWVTAMFALDERSAAVAARPP